LHSLFKIEAQPVELTQRRPRLQRLEGQLVRVLGIEREKQRADEREGGLEHDVPRKRWRLFDQRGATAAAVAPHLCCGEHKRTCEARAMF